MYWKQIKVRKTSKEGPKGVKQGLQTPRYGQEINLRTFTHEYSKEQQPSGSLLLLKV